MTPTALASLVTNQLVVMCIWALALPAGRCCRHNTPCCCPCIDCIPVGAVCEKPEDYNSPAASLFPGNFLYSCLAHWRDGQMACRVFTSGGGGGVNRAPKSGGASGKGLN